MSYDYQYSYIGDIEFESDECIIADMKSNVIGSELECFSDSFLGAKKKPYIVVTELRNKEPWHYYAKEIAEEDEYYEEILDMMFINQKLYDSLPEEDVDEKLDGLRFEWYASVKIKNFYLGLFETKYFNDPRIPEINETHWHLNNIWAPVLCRRLYDCQKNTILASHGCLASVTADTYDIYAIRDSKNKDILAIDIEITKDSVEDDTTTTSDKNTSYWTTGYNLGSRYFGNYYAYKKDNVNSPTVKTFN